MNSSRLVRPLKERRQLALARAEAAARARDLLRYDACLVEAFGYECLIKLVEHPFDKLIQKRVGDRNDQ